jgi:CheY-like chemotaxis protein
MFSKMLEALGCAVTVAETGSEGIALAKETPLDVVFVRIRATSVDGPLFVSAMRAALGSSRPALIAYSACTFEHERERAAAFDEFLVNPFQFERITECLSRHLSVGFEADTAVACSFPPTGPLDLAELRLSDEVIGRLRSAAEIGDFAALRRALAGVERQGPLPAEFARRLGVLAERFDTEAVLAALTDLPFRAA